MYICTCISVCIDMYVLPIMIYLKITYHLLIHFPCLLFISPDWNISTYSITVRIIVSA